MYRYRQFIKIVLIIFFLFTVYFIFRGLVQPEPKSNTLSGAFEADGVEMNQTIYDNQNRKAIEIRCTESKRASKDKILMKNLEATILKKGRMNKDIHVYGDDGFVENNFHNFAISKNGRIVSEDFEVKSQTFFLKDRALLRTRKKVEYRTHSLKGIARKGMEYYLNLNVIKFFLTRGSYERNEKPHQFQTDLLWFIENDRKLILQKRSLIKSENSLLKSDWISLTFFEDLENVQESSTIGNSYLFMGSREEKKYREIRSQNINSFYDVDGRLKSVEILKQGKVILVTPENSTRIQSDLIEITFNPETEKIEKVDFRFPGQIQNQGKTDFTIWADEMKLDFKDGEVKYCRGSGDCRLKIEDYRIETDSIAYDIDNHTIQIKGKNSTVFQENNNFKSTAFNINSKAKILKSDEGVKSIITLDNENILFSKNAIFVNAGKVKVLNKKNSFSYQKDVRLSQESTLLKTDKLEIDENNDLAAEGNVSLSFSNSKGGDEIVLRGNKVTFDSKNRKILIQDSAVIRGKEAVLKGDRLDLEFDQNNDLATIVGEKDIEFIKDNIQGSSQKVEWRFQKEFIIFTEAAELKKPGGGTAKGEKLEFNLKTEKVVIVSDETKRTETILD